MAKSINEENCYNHFMTKPWFRLNKWKKGWIPASWQGWILTIAYLAFTVYNFLRIDGASHSVSDTLINFIPQTIIFTGLFSVLCYFTADNASEKNILE